MTVEIIENTVEVPEAVNLTLDGHKVAVTGTNGTITRDFGHTKLNLGYQENTLRIWAENPKKKQASLVNKELPLILRRFLANQLWLIIGVVFISMLLRASKRSASG